MSVTDHVLEQIAARIEDYDTSEVVEMAAELFFLRGLFSYQRSGPHCGWGTTELLPDVNDSLEESIAFAMRSKK